MFSNFFGRRSSSKPAAPPINIGAFFVGRDAHLNTFFRYCDAQREERLRVLVVHGASGLGKSALLQRFRATQSELAPSSVAATFDISTLHDTTQAWRETLSALRDDLAGNDISLPNFDLLLGFTLAGEGGDAVLEPLLSPALSSAIRFASAALDIYAENEAALTDFLEEALSREAELFPALELTRFLADNATITPEFSAEVARLCQLVLRQDAGLPSLLIQAFAEDLDKALPAASPTAPSALRAAIYLDAYECLWDDRHAGVSNNERQLDWWVRELAANCLAIGVLPVLFGREPLMWVEDDPDWTSDDLVQTPLHGLSFENAQDFLALCGIGTASARSGNASERGLGTNKPGWSDPLLPSHSGEVAGNGAHDPLQAAIAHCCAGIELANRAVFARSATGSIEESQYSSEPDCHPLWLALCAAIVLNGRAAGKSDPPPTQFARINPEQAPARLTELFLRSLNSRPRERTLLKLAITPRFDAAVAEAQTGSAPNSDADSEWQMLRSLFFMRDEAPRGENETQFVRMHPLLRRELQARLRHEESLEEHLNLAHYWGGRGDAQLEWFHQWFIDPAGGLTRWRQRHRAALDGAELREARALLALWREVPLDEKEQERIGDALWARTHEAIARALLETPTPSPITACALAVDHLQNAHHGFIQHDFAAQRTQIQQLLQLARHRLLYSEGEVAISLNNPQRARDAWLEALPFFTVDTYPDEWRRLQTGLGYACRELAQSEAERDYRDPRGFSDTNFGRAIFHFEASLRVLTPENGLEIWGATQRELGILYKTSPTQARIENLRRAIACFSNALRYYNENTHPETWGEIQRLLGDCYVEFRLDDRPLTLRYAAGCYEAALRFYNEENYPDERARLYYDLGLVWGEFGDVGNNVSAFVAARDAFMDATRIYRAQNRAEESEKTDALIDELNGALKRFGADENLSSEADSPSDAGDDGAEVSPESMPEVVPQTPSVEQSATQTPPQSPVADVVTPQHDVEEEEADLLALLDEGITPTPAMETAVTEVVTETAFTETVMETATESPRAEVNPLSETAVASDEETSLKALDDTDALADELNAALELLEDQSTTAPQAKN